jgi:hypothetical protein
MNSGGFDEEVSKGAGSFDSRVCLRANLDSKGERRKMKSVAGA